MINVGQKMKTTARAKYSKLLQLLIEKRKIAGISQQQLGEYLELDQSNISRYERLELKLDIELLERWCEAIKQNMEVVLRDAGYLEIEEENYKSIDIAYPNNCEATKGGVNLCLKWRNTIYPIFFPFEDYELFLDVYKRVEDLFTSLNENDCGMSNRDAICWALNYAINMMPGANPSDIYHHLIYRMYVKVYRRTDPKQSWVRAGGEAVELFFKSRYYHELLASGIRIELAFQEKEKNKFLKDMNLADVIAGGSKLDVCLYGILPSGKLIPFAGVHVKASLAERVSDDKPCSERMMQAGFKSYLFTFDAKSFPPPKGNLENIGELGTTLNPTDKRSYIEQHGSFDGCFSYNTRTEPSPPGGTYSGKKIYTSKFDKNDEFIEVVKTDWISYRNSLNGRVL